MTNMKTIHESPGSYSHIERACEMMNMMIDRAGLPEEWKVEVPLKDDCKSFDQVLFGTAMVHVGEVRFLEGFMLGMAIASGTISIGKCREWLVPAMVQQPHEIASFGGAIRDVFAKEDEDIQPRKRRQRAGKRTI